MGKDEQLLHQAEEVGQTRKLERDEVLATAFMSLIESVSLAGAAGISAMVLKGLTGDDIYTWSTVGLAAGVGIVTGGLSFFFNISGNFGELREGLASYREVKTFVPVAPPSPQPGVGVHPPIMVHPYKGEPYTLGQPELPGREEALQLTPPVVAEVLKASLEQYGGEWSRRKLMRLRILGKNVTRGMYEELTGWLWKAGVLQQTRQGGFQLPPDVEEFEDLQQYFPNLLRVEEVGDPPFPSLPVPSRPSQQEFEFVSRDPVRLVERHRWRRMRELDYAVRIYLVGRE